MTIFKQIKIFIFFLIQILKNEYFRIYEINILEYMYIT